MVEEIQTEVKSVYMGNPLSYEEIKQILPSVIATGIEQILNIYQKHKDITLGVNTLRWGEEIENHLIAFEGEERVPKLWVHAKEIIEEMQGEEKLSISNEIGAWMIEIMPKNPRISLSPQSLLQLHHSITTQREEVRKKTREKGIHILQMTTPPILGSKNYAWGIRHKEYPLTPSINPQMEYLFFPESTIYPALKYKHLFSGMHVHREGKSSCRVPIMRDTHTDCIYKSIEEPYPGEVFLEGELFSFGGCSLQYTFEGACLNHARYLHDQLHALSPILAALSAGGASAMKGKLLDIDSRSSLITPSVLDDRSPQEKDSHSQHYIPGSRSRFPMEYISDHQYVLHNYMHVGEDMDMGQDMGQNMGMDPHPHTHPHTPQHILDIFLSNGCSPRLANYFASLFSRFPYILFDQKNAHSPDIVSQFFAFQQRNWPAVRLKCPMGLDMGWRVEIRCMELQFTDMENAAFGVFLGLLVNIITHFDVNFLIPISLAQLNEARCSNRDAVTNEKFYFRTAVTGDEGDYKHNLLQESDFLRNKLECKEGDCTPPPLEMSIEQILEGDLSLNYKGIIPLMLEYMEYRGYTQEEVDTIMKYLDIIRGRAAGRYKTPARFIRDFVLQHPDYMHDSIISDKITTDLFDAIITIDHNDDISPMKY